VKRFEQELAKVLLAEKQRVAQVDQGDDQEEDQEEDQEDAEVEEMEDAHLEEVSASGECIRLEC
jgi:hypothetical protein